MAAWQNKNARLLGLIALLLLVIVIYFSQHPKPPPESTLAEITTSLDDARLRKKSAVSIQETRPADANERFAFRNIS